MTKTDIEKIVKQWTKLQVTVEINVLRQLVNPICIGNFIFLLNLPLTKISSI